LSGDDHDPVIASLLTCYQQCAAKLKKIAGEKLGTSRPQAMQVPKEDS
jgi:hypothetical protein